MEFNVTPVNVDLSYEVMLTEPFFEIFEKDRNNLVKHLCRVFKVNLNEIKINHQTPSNDLYHIAKVYKKSFLDLSLGLEQIHISLANPEAREQVISFYKGITDTIKSAPILLQRYGIQQHFAVEGNIKDYLNWLNPNIPNGFKKLSPTAWAGYSLHNSEHELTINILVAPSLYHAGGLFLSVHSEFKPVICDFEKSLSLVEEYQALILKELGLIIKGL